MTLTTLRTCCPGDRQHASCSCLSSHRMRTCPLDKSPMLQGRCDMLQGGCNMLQNRCCVLQRRVPYAMCSRISAMCYRAGATCSRAGVMYFRKGNTSCVILKGSIAPRSSTRQKTCPHGPHGPRGPHAMQHMAAADPATEIAERFYTCGA